MRACMRACVGVCVCACAWVFVRVVVFLIVLMMIVVRFFKLKEFFSLVDMIFNCYFSLLLIQIKKLDMKFETF